MALTHLFTELSTQINNIAGVSCTTGRKTWNDISSFEDAISALGSDDGTGLMHLYLSERGAVSSYDGLGVVSIGGLFSVKEVEWVDSSLLTLYDMFDKILAASMAETGFTKSVPKEATVVWLEDTEVVDSIVQYEFNFKFAVSTCP